MDFLHQNSVPVSKSELEIFLIPLTQTAIESQYEVSYRPSASLEGSVSFEVNIPASDDFTDLQSTMVHMTCSVSKITETSKVKPVDNLANSLFEQIDLYLRSVNTVQANNSYHFQAYIEDIFFRHPNSLDVGRMEKSDENRIETQFDLYFRLHLPLMSQDKLLLSGVPLTLRFTRSPDTFPLIKYDAKDTASYKIKINQFAVHVKRLKLFPDAQLSILKALETAPAKYCIIRNETKSFTVHANQSSILPKRLILSLVSDDSFSGGLSNNPFAFNHFNLNFLACYVDGVMCPSISYQPDFKNSLYMREYVSLYKYLNQDEGLP